MSMQRYPSAIIGTTLGEPSFLIYMNTLDLKTEMLSAKGAQLVGAMSGVFQVRRLHPLRRSQRNWRGKLTVGRPVLSLVFCALHG